MAIPENLQVLTTIRDFIRWGSSEFLRNELCFGHGFVNAFDESRYLILHVLALPYDCPDTCFDAVLTLPERELVIDILQLRVSSRRPAAYITRESWFCGLKFYVDERVLVPRSPMAELISNHFEPWTNSGRVERILDLCTGSGCIAIASKYHFPAAEVCASDVSAEALEVAALNLEQHDLSDQVTLYESDLFDSIPAQSFDVIVSNPPYIDRSETESLPREVREHEPHEALFPPGSGTATLTAIIDQAAQFIVPGGLLALEIGETQADNVRGQIEKTGSYGPARTVLDLAGKTRLVLAERSPGQ